MMDSRFPVLEIYGDLHVKKDLVAFSEKGLPINIKVYGQVIAFTSLKPENGVFLEFLEIQGDCESSDIIFQEKESSLLLP